MKKVTGFTLLEVMISLSIAMLLTGTLIDLYLKLNQLLKSQVKEQHIFAEVAHLSNIVTDVTHQAGFIGCQRVRSDTPITPSNVIIGDDRSFEIRSMDTETAMVKKIAPDNSSIELDNTIHIKAGDTVIITNCQSSFKRTVATKHGNRLTLNKPIQQQKNMEIAKFNMYRLYTKQNAILLSQNNQNNTKLIDNIKKISISYLNHDNFIKSNAITNWRNVSAIQLSFDIESNHFSIVSALGKSS